MGKSNYPIQIADQQLTKDRIILSFVSGEQMYLNFLIVDKTAALSYQVNVETTSVFSNDPQRILVKTENYITKKTGFLTSKNG